MLVEDQQPPVANDLHLSVQQQAVASSLAPRLIVSALAGSGKTTTVAALVSNAARRFSAPVLVLAFTNAAVSTISARLAAAGLPDGAYEVLTVDALVYRVLCRALGVSSLNVDEDAVRACARWSLEKLSLPAESGFVSAVVDNAALWLNGSSSRSPLPRGLSSSSLLRVLPVFSARMVSQRVFSWELLRSFAAKNLPAHSPYSAVVVDEAQDLSPLHWSFVSGLSASCAQTVLVGDAYQSIFTYSGVDAALLPSLAARPDWSVLPLSETYRCPAAVAAAVRSLSSLSSLSGVAAYETHSSVSGAVNVITDVGDVAQQAAWLRANADFSAGVPVVLARTNETLRRLSSALGAAADNFRFSTVHSFKGDEAGTVYVVNIGAASGCLGSSLYQPEDDDRLLYVALTRAQQSVFLLCVRNLPNRWRCLQ
ncbi:UvrD-helicase domain-containing protein [Nesterenkonia aerolata]|uniref:UvrD-helicase domain-containing protein n=1 Tax=Nesterenkonia aerolata TaxID=3074079 RepID=A0ABU2DSD8_9MICC|nr:UvrD-helicase domain-containing protein [Nesterenkonia sp. LY-0111]MDR8019417.1 UvrD-helicase domain-containing protein [Nesterenkonia sp. LY-0111]